MKKLLATGIILVLSHFASANESQPSEKLPIHTNAWNDFEGKLGKTKVSLSFYLPENTKVLAGNYCYNKYDQRIQLKGDIAGNHIEFDEFSEGKSTGHFSGNITQDKMSSYFKGVWTSPSGDKKIKFSLSHTSSVFSNADSRYFQDESDVEVEAFVKKVKKAILHGDRNWVAKHISYPINVDLKGKRTKITSEKKLKQHFNEIFHHSYKTSIKSASICNMFSNAQGVMFGGGRMWINGNSIIAINN